MARPAKSAPSNDAPTATPEKQLSLDASLEGLIGYAMRRAQLKLFQTLINHLSAHDLRPAQFSALAIIDQNPGLMQADLAKALAIEPPQVVPLLNKLEERALAVRVRCKPDKRSYGIFLSKAGEILLKELKLLAVQSDVEATSALNTVEREELLRLLKMVYQSA
ncbi:MarR family winged helix-turn-helix transcriptional regulator [Pseudomonas sp. G5(2012)]|uniref:MarR family winged helix-turn-helix transcriptional regulator n=1 Tax=Pseudomonas sp. G5(2012) TaxID=1268068 RepID=UPI0003A0047C|nr:MarR family transcriptional regulator [Pseudomonas sp. G5(2012)]